MSSNMDDEIDYKKLYENEKKKTEILEKENFVFKTDPVKRGYFSLCRILNLQVDALNEFRLKESIGGKKSEDASFERMQGIWSNLPSMITNLNDLKVVLRITPEEEKSNVRLRGGTSPESVASSLNNVAGQNN